MNIKRIYFGISFTHREEYRVLYEAMKKYFEKFDIEVYSFVFNYDGPTENRIMLKNALDEMNKSDILIADALYGSIGVGMEVGYFKGQGKKVIYLHKNSSFLDENMDGVSDYVINYDTDEDVLNWIDKNFQKNFVVK